VRPRALLAVLALAGTSFAMMQALVIPALPRIQASLGTNTDGAAWIATAYLLSASVLTPVIGRLGDTAGKKRMMMASLAAFAAGTMACALAANLGELVAGRVIQGAAGGIYPLAFAIIRDRLPRERSRRASAWSPRFSASAAGEFRGVRPCSWRWAWQRP
jgi:MFS family permease